MGIQDELMKAIVLHQDKSIVKFIGELHKMLNIEIEVKHHRPKITQADKVTTFIRSQTFIARVNGEVVLERSC